MNTDTHWLDYPYIKPADIARQMGISRDLLSKKINNTQGNQFNEQDLIRLNQIRLKIIDELTHNQPVTVS